MQSRFSKLHQALLMTSRLAQKGKRSKRSKTLSNLNLEKEILVLPKNCER